MPDLSGLDDCRPSVERMRAAFSAMIGAASQTAHDVAEVVYAATADGTDRLRYPVRARRTLDGQDYVDFLRRRFGVK
ncbi:hypothetical protein C7405_112168 [Paraburkholderia caballeronis]|nr:hypothetical protein C7405_112168 [Paraburkholderia caballeronis]